MTNHHDEKSGAANSIVRAVQIGVITGVCLTALKLAGGWVFKSSSLSADGWHSAGDMVSDLIALVVVRACQHLRTNRKDTSVARLLEETSSLVSSGALVALGLQMAWENMNTLQFQFFTISPDLNTPLHVAPEHSVNPSGTNVHAVWIALVTVIVKEWLYHRTLKVAKDESSTLLKSTAMHHRLDGLMSFVTIATVLLTNMGIGAVWMDSLGGLGISLLLTQGALRNLGSACGGLVR
ncbi:hypothetical protein CEP54_015173 [Fusarium duplospermum]|uniref:Cation efflux protein transmembrane domain-containing protein n=1 Tax=Fusarium duplospermum TaxID=1325734 RepID=A0A428NQZ9_9HYPO|nr:hypothetical protein CEP54_015173 [Fusarium duplospermum]